MRVMIEWESETYANVSHVKEPWKKNVALKDIPTSISDYD